MVPTPHMIHTRIINQSCAFSQQLAMVPYRSAKGDAASETQK